MSNSEPRSDGQQMSFGVGGAGNIRKASGAVPQPDALQTPTLKEKNYSTGRGGTGNIAKNDPEKPEIARKSQDVDVPPMKVVEEEYHIGRGGAANTYKVAREYNENTSRGSTSSSERPKGIAWLAKKVVGLKGLI